MKPETVQALNDINRRFYRTTATAFDETRQYPWAGWEPLLPHVPARRPLRVLDVGCGNGRFGVFLARHLAGDIHYHGLDNNPALLAYAQEALTGRSALRATLEERDIVLHAAGGAEYDLVVLFGVLHHVPGAANRAALLRSLAGQVAAGGLLAFAAWRFMDSERLSRKVTDWPPGLERERGDYLLDWRRGEVALRYCHFVDDAEHAALVNATGLSVVADYRADGSDNRGNRYTVLGAP